MSSFYRSPQRWCTESGSAGQGKQEYLIDLELDPRQINEELWQDIQALSLGPGNPVPVLTVRGVELQQAAMVGSEGRHQVRLQGSGLNAIALTALNMPVLGDNIG